MIRKVITTVFATVSLVLFGAAAASATTPPDASAAVKSAAGQLSNGVIDTFVDVLPYAIPVLLAFWGYSAVRGMIGAKRKKPS